MSTVPYLTLTSDGGTVYNFSGSFWIIDNEWTKTSSIKNIAYAHGGRNVADNFLQARTITIEGLLYADSIALLETAERLLVKAILRGGKLTVSDDTVSRYIDVRYGSKSGTYILEGNRYAKPYTITFIAEYPFWQDSTETTDTQVLAGNGTFTVDNSGSDEIVLPIIEIIADQAADLPGIRIKNKTDGNMVFEYIDASFLAGAALIIDSSLGTVKLNNNDAMEYVTIANFLRLQPEINTFAYEGNACTINVKFRKVYL